MKLICSSRTLLNFGFFLSLSLFLRKSWKAFRYSLLTSKVKGNKWHFKYLVLSNFSSFVDNCIELSEIILKNEGLYLRFKLVNFILIDIKHVGILQFFDELFSGHITISFHSNLSGLLDNKLLIVKLDFIWCIRISGWYFLGINFFWIWHDIWILKFKPV